MPSELPPMLEPWHTYRFADGRQNSMFTADQMTAYALLAVKQERARIDSSEVVQFLYGAGDLDGVGYSEVPVGKPRYWWRSVLRAVIRQDR